MSFAFVFPGQGSQSVGMMAAYGDSAIVRATFDEASQTLGDDLWAMVADGPADLLTQTVNTQPVMLTAGIAAWRLWQEKGGRTPAVVAGHSLGEYAALVAAGVEVVVDVDLAKTHTRRALATALPPVVVEGDLEAPLVVGLVAVAHEVGFVVVSLRFALAGAFGLLGCLRLVLVRRLCRFLNVLWL